MVLHPHRGQHLSHDGQCVEQTQGPGHQKLGLPRHQGTGVPELENVGSIDGDHGQGRPLPVHDQLLREAEQLTVNTREWHHVGEIGRGLLRHHHAAKQEVKDAQV